MKAWLALVLIGCTPTGDFEPELISHRGNGCDDDAAENSYRAIRCVIDQCVAGQGPCSIELDLQLVSVTEGPTGDGIDIVLSHDSKVDAACAFDGKLELPGRWPYTPAQLESCLVEHGDHRHEPIARFEDVLSLVGDAALTLYLELKYIELDPSVAFRRTALERRFGELAIALVERSPLAVEPVFVSFSEPLLQRPMELDYETGCNLPLYGRGSSGTGRVLTQAARLGGQAANDAHECLRADHTYVAFNALGYTRAVAEEMGRAHAQVMLFGVESGDGYRTAWRERDDLVGVYADRPGDFVR